MGKHFFKLLSIFIFLIVLGMAGILLVSHFDDRPVEAETANSASQR